MDPFLNHEALHMSNFLAQTVARELCEHPAISGNAEWLAKATLAADALGDLYQAIGAEMPWTNKENGAR